MTTPRIALALVVFASLPAAGQICGPTYLRGTACPDGATSSECVRWNAPLTIGMIDRNALNTLAVCGARVEDWPTECATGQVLTATAGGALACSDLSALGAAFGILDLATGTDPTATTTGDTLALACSGITCTGGAKSLALTVAADASAATASLRTLGTGAAQAAAGNDARLSDSRTPSGAAGGDLAGTYPSPSVVDDSHAHTAATLPASSTTGAGLVELATDGEATAGLAVQANDARLANARTPSAHATSHQNGGSDEVATATPTASAIPKAGAGGTLASGWIPTLSYLPLAGGTLTGAVVGTWFDASFFRGMVGSSAVVQINRGTQAGGRSNGISLAQNRDICWSSAATADDSFDACLYRPSANVLELTDGSAGNSRLQARGVRLIPRSSPVSACDASTRGLSYYDSDDGDFCDCVASGYRSRGGAGTCN